MKAAGWQNHMSETRASESCIRSSSEGKRRLSRSRHSCHRSQQSPQQTLARGSRTRSSPGLFRRLDVAVPSRPSAYSLLIGVEFCNSHRHDREDAAMNANTHISITDMGTRTCVRTYIGTYIIYIFINIDVHTCMHTCLHTHPPTHPPVSQSLSQSARQAVSHACMYVSMRSFVRALIACMQGGRYVFR